MTKLLDRLFSLFVSRCPVCGGTEWKNGSHVGMSHTTHRDCLGCGYVDDFEVKDQASGEILSVKSKL